MVELDEEMIDVIKKVKDALKQTTFDINRFEIGETGVGGAMISIDIRRHKE
jgi:hypothetical protein